MILRQTKIPNDRVAGIYGINAHVCDDEHIKYTDAKGVKRGKKGPNYGKWDLITPGGLPERFRSLEPSAAVDFLRITQETGHLVVCSDMFRSPQSSLTASLEPGRSAKPPGESGHNYGESIDIHVEAMLARTGMKRKRDLDALFARFNWYCFWLDGRGGKEWWHYNHIAPEYRDRSGGFTGVRTSGYLERMIRLKHGAQFKLTIAQCQAALNAIGFEVGDADGKLGKLTRKGLTGFESHWMPKKPAKDRGTFDPATQRLLAYLTATVEWVELPT